MMLSEAIDEFMLEQRCRGNSAATLLYYSSVLKYFADYIGEVDVASITLRNLQEYKLQLSDEDSGLTSVSIQSYVRGLRAFMKWLYEYEYIDADLCQRFKLPKATRKVIDVLTDMEISVVFTQLAGDDWLSIRNRLIIALMLDCGLRLEEVVTLTVDSVHLTERYLIVQHGKGDKQRIVPFGEKTWQLFKRWFDLRIFQLIGGKGALLIKESSCGNYYEPITRDTLKMFFRRLKDRTGIPRLRAHLLRHTFATRYLENGGNIYSLQSILGHTSLEMVKRYLHLATTRIRSDFGKFSPLDRLSEEKDRPP